MSASFFTAFVVVMCVIGFVRGFMNPKKYTPSIDPAVATLKVARAYRLLGGWHR